MIQAVKLSTEPGHLKQEAIKYLKGLKGALVQKKKKEAEKKAANANPNPVPEVDSDQVQGQQIPDGTAISS